MYTYISSKSIAFLIKKHEKMAKSNSNNSGGNGNMWGAIAQGAMAIGGGLIGGAQGKKAQKRQHGYNLDIMEKQNAYLHEQNEANQARQFDMWKKTNADAQVQEYKNAGLNVGLMYEGGGLQGTTGSTTSSAPSGGGNYSDLGLSSKGMEIGSQVAQTLANIELTKAQAENVKADTEMKQGVETDLKEAQITDITQGVQNKQAQEVGQKLQNDLLNMEKQVQGATIEDKINRIVWDTERALYDLNIMARMDRFDEASYKDRLSIITNTVLESIAKQANLKADTSLKGAQTTNTNADTALKELTTKFMPEYLSLAMKSNAYENRDSLSRQKEAMTNEWKSGVEKQLRERGLDQKDTEILINGLDKALENIWKGAKAMK